ncbi:MAG: PKD domain-containing protein, partial [Flavobacteriales bacterium]|nr:PKD domain-containing protein [Flavobacteriales bacterium]
DLYDGTAWVTDIAPPISGDQGDQWIQETVDLSNWIGQTVVIRFRGITGGDFTSDMALDQIAILDVAAPPVVSFVADPPAGCLGDVVTLVDLSQNLPTAWSWDIQPATGVNYVNGTSSSSATPQVVFTQAGTYSVALTASNMFGGSTVTQPSAVQQVDGVGLAMAVTTDRYGSETTWTVTGGTSTYASGGPYATVSASGAYPQDTVLFCVPGGTCMDLTVYDSFGDGMCCAYGAGGYQLLTLTGDTLVNGDGQFTTVRTDNFCAPYNLRLQLRAWLEGAHLAGSTLMRDDLRASGLIPLVSPYPALGFIGAEDATISPSVLATTGPDAIVDWVLIELRDPASPSTIVRTAGALLQRDGDVVATDGISPVTILGDAASYLVAIRHRNHLGAMLLNAVPLGGATAVLDLTDGSVPMWGSGALNDLNGTWALASGNVVVDGTMKYTGIDNDRDPILQAIGGAVPTNTVTGYSNADLNMDGIVQYAGVGNDRDIILDNIGGSLPTAVRPEQLP